MVLWMWTYVSPSALVVPPLRLTVLLLPAPEEMSEIEEIVKTITAVGERYPHATGTAF